MNVVSLPSGVTEVPSGVATICSQTASSGAQQQMENVDLLQLSVEEQGKVRSLLEHYSSVFSISDTDLDFTNLVSHNIPLIDATPVKQVHSRV